MRREDRFVMSHKQYAADLASLNVTSRFSYQGREFFPGVIRAVWFRRRRRGGYGPEGAVVTVACVGTLWCSQDVRPADGRAFLEGHTDGRYGGDCAGRWDGTGYWGAENPDVRDEHLALLQPMLDNFPAVPDGFDGWWTFQ